MKTRFLTLCVAVGSTLSTQAAVVILPSATATSMVRWGSPGLFDEYGLDGTHGSYTMPANLTPQTIHAGDTVQFSLMAAPGQFFQLKRGFQFLQAGFSFGSSNTAATSDLSLFVTFAGGSGSAGPTKLESGALSAHVSAIVTFIGPANTFQFNEFRFTWTAANTVDVGALPFSEVHMYTDSSVDPVPYLTMVPEPALGSCLLLGVTLVAGRRRGAIPKTPTSLPEPRQA